MTDKIVTHAELNVLRDLRDYWHDGGRLGELLDRLIAAAEADVPPLPEGWVLCVSHEGDECVRWHTDGRFYQWRSCDPRDVYSVRDGFANLTPLRPTISEADVEKATGVAIEMEFSVLQSGRWDEIFRAAFKAAGIEVQS